MGFTLRSFLLSKGFRGVTTRKNPPTVSPAADHNAQTSCRHNRPQFLGSYLSRVPFGSGGFRTFTDGCSLGVYPSRVHSRRPWSGFRPTSSLALFPPGFSPGFPAPQSIDQPSPALFRVVTRMQRPDQRTLRGFRTASIRNFRKTPHPWL